eukprot:TRINITY_DN3529_c0_g1_i1.p1 TRINITY_DN3529_c0_g1~~TRINITY_DN3529_c0_g1_i1.p1  ORF type:complete len:163 (+),score=14.45 TRINITY_DN3529_c0_g1_i1:34-489(+)
MKLNAQSKIPKGYEFVDPEKAIMPEWLKLKYLMRSVYNEASTNMANELHNKIQTEAKTMQVGTNIIKLFEVYMLLPYSTAACERGFSLRTNIKTSKRNKLQASTIDTIMKVKAIGMSEELLEKAVESFEKKRRYQVIKKIAILPINPHFYV